MIAVILEREDNPCIISHCKLIIKRIEAHTKGNLTAFSPHFFPRSALPINTPESNTKSPKYALMSIIANQGYSKAERKQKISSFSQYCDHTWTQIAGSSSPVDIQVAHTLQPELSSVVCSNRINSSVLLIHCTRISYWALEITRIFHFPILKLLLVSKAQWNV